MGKTACFTGHRPQKLPFGFDEEDMDCRILKTRIKKHVLNALDEGFDRFIIGMAQGIDTWAGEILAELKSEGTNLALEAAIPCPGQADRWSKKHQERYQNLLSMCDRKTIVSHTYCTKSMHLRNIYMVDHSDLVIAVCQNTSGGTKFTINYAKSKNKPIVYIPVINNNLSMFD